MPKTATAPVLDSPTRSLDPQIAYDLRRAQEERTRALDCANIWARAAHHEMALAYERRVWRRDPQLLSTLR